MKKRVSYIVASALALSLGLGVGGSLFLGGAEEYASAQTLNEDKRIFEAEKGELSGEDQYVLFGKSCSNGKFLTNIGKERSTATFSFDGTAGDYALSVKMAYVGADLTMDKLLGVEVNGVALDLSKQGVYKTNNSSYSTYNEFPAGDITLVDGENEIVFTLISDNFNFDYFAVAKKTEYTGGELLLPAENARINGSVFPKKDEADPTIAGITGAVNNEKLIFSVYSDADRACDLSVLLRSAKASTTDCFNLSVNGKDAKMTAALNGANGWQEADLGVVYMRRGENVIILTSFSGSTFYDGLRLREKHIALESGENVLSAPLAACLGESRIGTNGEAEYNEKTSSVTFVVESECFCAANLAVDVSYWGVREKVTDVVYVTVNGYLLSFDDLAIVSNSGEGDALYRTFYSYDLGAFTLQEGANVITITARASSYNLRGITVAV